MRKVGESVNVKKKMSTICWRKCKCKKKKKNEYNFMSTIFFYLNLSKILHFSFFKTKRERKYK